MKGWLFLLLLGVVVLGFLKSQLGELSLVDAGIRFVAGIVIFELAAQFEEDEEER